MTHTPPVSDRLVIIGAGGHAVSVAGVAASAGYRIHCFVDPGRQGEYLLGAAIIGDLADAGDLENIGLAIAAGDNAVREKIYGDITARFGARCFPALRHASAVISDFCSIGSGTVIMPGAVIGPNSAIGGFCIVNTGASIDHDGVMHRFSSLAPGVVTGGAVEIGIRSAVSIGAIVKHGVKIGNDVVVGAGSYLNKDLPDGTVAYGTPARILRLRNPGDPYLN